MVKKFTASALLCFTWNCSAVVVGDASMLDTPDVVDSPTASVPSWRQLAVSDLLGCGLRDSGAVYCWGVNSSRELWGGREFSIEPRRIALPLAAEALVVKGQAACAQLVDHTLYCWGSNIDGELGRGTITLSRDRLAQGLAAGQVAFTGVTALREPGSGPLCAIHAMGQLSCWGPGAPGTFGVTADRLTQGGINLCAPTPVHITLPLPVRNVAPSSRATCAALTDGSVWCWGDNTSGQFGNEVPINPCEPTSCASLTPQRAHVTNVRRLFSPNFNSMCGVRDDGSVYCWGGGLNPLRSQGRTSTPLPLALPDRVTDVGVGTDYACVRLANEQTWCWGASPFEESMRPDIPADPPTHNPAMDRFVSFGGNFGVSYGIDRDGVAWVWGRSTALLGSAAANNDQWHGEPIRLPDPIE